MGRAEGDSESARLQLKERCGSGNEGFSRTKKGQQKRNTEAGSRRWNSGDKMNERRRTWQEKRTEPRIEMA